MEEVGKGVEKRQPVKWWIRRHRVLALLAPFVIAIVALTLIVAVQGDSWGDFVGGAKFGFALSIYGLAAFQEGMDHQPFSPIWYAEILVWPLYILPAIAFVISRNAKAMISAYVVYCLLVVIAIYSGAVILADCIGSC